LFDQSTSPTIGAIIRDIEQLYLLLSDGTSDGQTGSPENAWQETQEGGDAGAGGGDGGAADGNVDVPNGAYGSNTQVPVITVSDKSITVIAPTTISPTVAITASDGTYGSTTQSVESVISSGKLTTLTNKTISPAVAITASDGTYGGVSAGTSISIPTVTISGGKLTNMSATTVSAITLTVCDGGTIKTLTVYGTLT
jgi:hypothetical protein